VLSAILSTLEVNHSRATADSTLSLDSLTGKIVHLAQQSLSRGGFTLSLDSLTGKITRLAQQSQDKEGAFCYPVNS
jgi:hypothetical protein